MNTTQQVIDLARIKTAMVKIARENPDYVYEKINSYCEYTRSADSMDSEYKGCIVGRAIISEYPDAATTLREIDDEGSVTFFQAIDIVEFTYKIIGREHAKWIKSVQEQQDRDQAWGQIIEGLTNDE